MTPLFPTLCPSRTGSALIVDLGNLKLNTVNEERHEEPRREVRSINKVSYDQALVLLL